MHPESNPGSPTTGMTTATPAADDPPKPTSIVSSMLRWMHKNPNHASDVLAAPVDIDKLPTVSKIARERSLHGHAISKTAMQELAASTAHDRTSLPDGVADGDDADHDSTHTILYFAYGSNLSKDTFLKSRGIRPVAKVNAIAYDFRLTFDLPGIPYLEARFANIGPRSERPDEPGEPVGMVGVVYQISVTDYAHLMATEGGGSSYQDVQIDCFALSTDLNSPLPSRPVNPTTTQFFRAHTLFCPLSAEAAAIAQESASRPDGLPVQFQTSRGEGQPSARYLNILREGAKSNKLPLEYQNYLNNLNEYPTDRWRTWVGMTVVRLVWFPPMIAVMVTGSLLSRRTKTGDWPGWVRFLSNAIRQSTWLSYDFGFKWIFGDGEGRGKLRTAEDNGHNV